MKVEIHIVEQELGGYALYVDGAMKGAGTKAQVIRGVKNHLQKHLGAEEKDDG